MDFSYDQKEPRITGVKSPEDDIPSPPTLSNRFLSLLCNERSNERNSKLPEVRSMFSLLKSPLLAAGVLKQVVWGASAPLPLCHVMAIVTP